MLTVVHKMFSLTGASLALFGAIFLGLALVAAIATAHGGKARVASNAGFEITVDL